MDWASKKKHTQQLRQAVNSWVAFTIENKIVQIFEARVSQRTIHLVLKSWKGWAQFAFWRRRMVAQSMQTRAKAKLLKTFQAWLNMVANTKEALELFKRAEINLQSRRLLLHFQSWRIWLNAHIERKDFLHRLMGHMTVVRKGILLSAWLNYTRASMAKRSVFLSVSTREIIRSAHIVLLLWKHTAEYRMRCRDQIRCVQIKFNQNHLQSCFVCWREWTIRGSKAVVAAALFRERLKKELFVFWRKKTIHDIASKEIVHALSKKSNTKVWEKNLSTIAEHTSDNQYWLFRIWFWILPPFAFQQMWCYSLVHMNISFCFLVLMSLM